MADTIVALNSNKIPTVVSYDIKLDSLIIGDAAKTEGLNNQTNMFNFKMDLGRTDREFSEVKKYWYGLYGHNKESSLQKAENFTAKEVTTFFLKELLKDIVMPGKIIIGEPAIREQTWRDNFKKHIREIFKDLGHFEVEFFFEPFAVFQYYRLYEKKFPVTEKSEIILVIDIGGGTFNSCIIQTKNDGKLSRGGANAIPLGLQAEECGGSVIDLELLKIIVSKCEKKGIKWKDNPIERAKSPALFRIEEAKIKLSEMIGQDVLLHQNFKHLTEAILFPTGSLYADSDIKETITGEDLKSVIRQVWRKHYGDIIIRTISEAEKKIGAKIKKLDKIIVAGGSAKMPFIKEEIEVAVRTRLTSKDDIIIGDDLGNAVAFGIACECRELVNQKNYHNLSVGRIAPCLLSDLYVCFKKERRGAIQLPAINGEYNGGLLYSSPFSTDQQQLSYLLELDFDPNDKIYYYFSNKPFDEDDFTFLNVTNYVLSIQGKVSRKLELTIDIDTNGIVIPTFNFRGKGSDSKKLNNTLKCPEIYLDEISVKEGVGYIGIDFGTSNSYLAKLVDLKSETKDICYPSFSISKSTTVSLLELETQINDHRESGLLNRKTVSEHAVTKIPHMVYHSIKIEGNKLTEGETVKLLESKHDLGQSKDQKEAINLERAFEWVIQNLDALYDEPESFLRHINKIILDDLSSDAGQYRKGPVELSGMEYTPPPAYSVSPFMSTLAQEIRLGIADRSSIEFAASIHTKFVMIHPFSDGNGRTARLFMNAIMLANSLPMIIINYADKQRYIDTIVHANKGDLSALVDFYIDCFKSDLEDYLGSIYVDDTFVDQDSKQERIVEYTEGASLLGTKFAKLLNDKLTERNKVKESEYQKWSEAFDRFGKTLENKVVLFNENRDVKEAGYSLKITKYDNLTFDKYLDLDRGKHTPRTWFFRVDISHEKKYEKIMFFFQNSSYAAKTIDNSSHVSLGIARHDGAQYRRLQFEPITLKEIILVDSTIHCFLKNNILSDKDCWESLMDYLIYDVLTTYID